MYTFKESGDVNMVLFSSLWIVVLLLILASLKVVKEYERGVVFTLGKYTGIRQPGLRLIIPIIQSWERIDIRIKTVDVPSQDCVSKDNISIKVNAVLYYRIEKAEKAVIEVENYRYAMAQLAQTTMRNIVGEFELDDILQKRDNISKKIKSIVDKDSDPWGIDVTKIEIKDIELPMEMKRTIAKEAEAERERRAVVIKAEGEVTASKNMAKAADTLAKAPGALHLRTLQSINDMSSDQSNTVIFTIPLEVLESFVGHKKKKE
ncbi:slipin family protein [Candidatus Woesearchaeota archaeon]|nr:slipin family protein [Candidatus Woesearchaeota archaeon]